MNKQAGFIPIAISILIVLTLLVGGGAIYFAEREGLPDEPQDSFNFVFRYGVGAKNELNTFEQTFTKDMIVDPSVTVKMSLTNQEMNRIYQKMVEIDFFNYPNFFTAPSAGGGPIGTVTPSTSYYFRVANNGSIKELSWDNDIISQDEKTRKLIELIQLIENIIRAKDEYKALPEPQGGYL